MKKTINGISLAYEDIGTGPAVVLVHGFPLDRGMWQPQTAELARAGYRVIVPDLRGFGQSQVPSKGWTLSHLAADLAGLLSYLGIGRAVFCGFAMGGSVLLQLLERHPDKVDGLEKTPAFIAFEKIDLRICARIDELRRANGLATLKLINFPDTLTFCESIKVAGACFVSSRVRCDDILEKVRRSELVDKLSTGNREEVLAVLTGELLGEGGGQRHPELAVTLRDWLELVDTRSLIWGLQAIRDRKNHPLGIRKFFQPILVISGSRDTLIAPEHGEQLAKGVPLGVAYELADSGHLVNLEQPEKFNACLLDFLGDIRQKRCKQAELKQVA